MNPKKIYLAVPYSHPDPAVRDARYDAITDLAAELMGKGHLVFSTITYTHHMAQKHVLPTNYEFWHTLNTSFIEWADVLLVKMLDGWPANVLLSIPDDEYALRGDVTEEQSRSLMRWLDENPEL